MELISTKLFMPPVPPDLVHRPRLVERLREGFNKKLTLISAPAGFGKTTLLSECFDSIASQVGWVSLDEDDNDPSRFWSYFITALQGIRAEIGEAAIRLIQSPQPPTSETLLTELLNELTDCVDTLGHPCVVVLDDYDVIDNASIHKGVAFLINRMPPQMHVIISTRADPPLPLDHLSNHDQLSELRTGDLRFTPEEATSLLNNLIGIGLSEEDMAVLDARTEGWAICLKMAALSIRGREDIRSFITSFRGSRQSAIDYLSEELLSRQTGEVQLFLLRTSILDRLTGALCNAVVGRRKSAQILRQLEESSLFVTPLDREQTWYRYHSLFADLLQRRLHQFEHSRVKTLHDRASRWFERKGLTNDAIAHALGAGDYHRAAILMEEAAEATFMRGEIATFLSWVEALPDSVIVCQPRLCTFIAWALLLNGSPLTTIQEHLQIAAGIDPAGLASGEVAMLCALMAAIKGDAKQSSELADLTLKLLPDENKFLRNVLASNLGLIYLLTGDVRSAQPVFEEAIRVGRDTDNLMLTVIGLQRLAELHIARGQLHEAKICYEWILDLAVDSKGRILPVAGIALVGLGDLLREWNDLKAAKHCLEEGIDLMTEWGDAGAILGYVALAQIKQAENDLSGAKETIHKAKQLAPDFDRTEVDDIQVAAKEARLHITWGDLEGATLWAEENGLLESSGPAKAASVKRLPYAMHELQYITLSRLLIAKGQADSALEVLDPWLTMAEGLGRIGSVIHILILKALAFDARGDTARAKHSLTRAISLAQPGGYIRLFADEGEPMARLLRGTATRGATRKYVKQLMNAF